MDVLNFEMAQQNDTDMLHLQRSNLQKMFQNSVSKMCQVIATEIKNNFWHHLQFFVLVFSFVYCTKADKLQHASKKSLGCSR